MLCSNTEDIPGQQIVEFYGVVTGSTVRAKHIGRDIAASLKNFVGGELKGYTELLQEARQEALHRMMEQARSVGAHAVINVRFATSSIAQGAAELFAAALTDTARAETVGLRTAGRVAEQPLVRLPDGGGLLLSSTRYLTASGEPIHRVGVEPAVVVPIPTVELGRAVADPDLDPVLDRALEHLAAMPTV